VLPSSELRIYKTRVYGDLCEDVPGLLDAALVCEHGPDPVGRPDVSRVMLQHILEVVDGSILILSLLAKRISVEDQLLISESNSYGTIHQN